MEEHVDQQDSRSIGRVYVPLPCSVQVCQLFLAPTQCLTQQPTIRVVQQSSRLLSGYGDVYDQTTVLAVSDLRIHDRCGPYAWMPLQVMAACSNDKEVSAALTYMAISTQHNQDFPVAGFNLEKTPTYKSPS